MRHCPLIGLSKQIDLDGLEMFVWHHEWSDFKILTVRSPTASVLICTGYSKAPGMFRVSDYLGWVNLSASKITWQCPLFFSLCGSGKEKVCRTPIQDSLILFPRVTRSINVWRQTEHTSRQKIDTGLNFCVLSEHHASQDTDCRLHLLPESTEHGKLHHFVFSKLVDIRFCDRRHKSWTCPIICLMKINNHVIRLYNCCCKQGFI